MAKKIIMALAGNPNAGKTSLFNQLTGARAHVGNYPGVTVAKREGLARHKDREIQVVDLPGIYSLTAYSLEELVARDFILEQRPDIVVCVVDASNLERNLYLVVQFLEIGLPVVVALNMMDVAESRGTKIEVAKLSSLLGVPLVPTMARSKKGIDDLLAAVCRTADQQTKWNPRHMVYGPDLEEALTTLSGIISDGPYDLEKYPPRWLALKALEGDRQVLDLLTADQECHQKIISIVQQTASHLHHTLDEEPEGVIADQRYGYINAITRQTVFTATNLRRSISEIIDLVALNRLLGPVILLAILYALYQFVFSASAIPVAWCEAFFKWLSRTVRTVLPDGPLQSLLTSGVVDGLGGVLGFVPLIAVMFMAVAVLEDSGYLARAAFLMDRVLRSFGLHGNSVLSLMLGGGLSGGCAVPGVFAARTLRDPRERLATILVTPFMNCGAKIPVLAVLIAAFFQGHQAQMMFLLTLIAWVMALTSARILRWTVLRGELTPFVMELPPYRLPTVKGVLIHSWERVWEYLRKAGTIILAISILMWALMSWPGVPDDLQRVFDHQRQDLTAGFLAGPGGQVLGDKKALTNFNGYWEGLSNEGSKDQASVILDASVTFARLRQATDKVTKGQPLDTNLANLEGPAKAYLDYRKNLAEIDAAQSQAGLKHSAAGRLGLALEKLTRPLGFDWRIDISLLGGLAAKEVILTTMGTAYSLGDTESGGSESLGKRLAGQTGWNPLSAFTLMLFVMMYSPCVATLVAIAREIGWRWSVFSIVYNTGAAYLLSLTVAGIGRALKLGV